MAPPTASRVEEFGGVQDIDKKTRTRNELREKVYEMSQSDVLRELLIQQVDTGAKISSFEKSNEKYMKEVLTVIEFIRMVAIIAAILVGGGIGLVLVQRL
tara:strand:+ start:83 stop:382 length:300 start_codon:yes stop_codon:yes gene_type:complete